MKGGFTIMQEKLIEDTCVQIKTCLGRISNFATNELYTIRDYHLLKLELQHLDLLLDLLESKITIESYLTEHNLLFSNEDEDLYGSPSEFSHPLLFLEKAEIDVDTISIDEEVRCFISILQICRENIKKHIVSENYDKIYDEYYYNHNVPWLIQTKCKYAIKAFLLNECANCKKYCSKEMVASYEDAWKAASSQFLSNIDFYGAV